MTNNQRDKHQAKTNRVAQQVKPTGKLRQPGDPNRRLFPPQRTKDDQKGQGQQNHRATDDKQQVLQKPENAPASFGVTISPIKTGPNALYATSRTIGGNGNGQGKH